MKIFVNLITALPFDDLKFFSIYEAINNLKDHRVIHEFVSPAVSSLFWVKIKLNYSLILVCNIFVATTNIVNHKIKSTFLIEIQTYKEAASEALNHLEREVLKEFQNLKPQWVLLIFLIAKSFLNWSLIIKSSLFEKKIVLDCSNNNHFFVLSANLKSLMKLLGSEKIQMENFSPAKKHFWKVKCLKLYETIGFLR